MCCTTLQPFVHMSPANQIKYQFDSQSRFNMPEYVANTRESILDEICQDQCSNTPPTFSGPGETTVEERRSARNMCTVRQKQRQMALSHACRSEWNSSAVDVRPETWAGLPWGYICRPGRFMIALVPKVMSSSWHEKLYEVEYHKPLPVFPPKMDAFLWILQALSSSSLVNMTENRLLRLGPALRSFTRVIFVRHPAARIVSAYIDKMESKPTQTYIDIAATIAKCVRQRGSGVGGKYKNLSKYKNMPTFPEFIEGVVLKVVLDTHWTSASNFTRPCDVGYNFIGHGTTATEDVDCLLRRTNLSLGFPSKYHPQYPNLHEYFSQVPTSIIRDFESMFRRDYEIFGHASILDAKTGKLKNFTDEPSLDKI